jgi:hypothetical protein
VPDKPKQREETFEAPVRSAMPWTPPDRGLGFGDRPPMVTVAFTHVEAYEGVLWRCDVCMAVIAEFGPDHAFIDRDGLDAFQRHAKWHRALLVLETER